MNQNKIGSLIKELRQKSNLTQKEFANKYGVTYQAVSKWENGKNLPDTLILKEICKDYNINIADILEGNIKPKKEYKIFLLISGILLLIGSLTLFINNYNKNRNNNFEFKTISSNCEDFKLNGSIAYNENKSVIYISNIEYCGNNDNEIYKSLNATLYEQKNNTKTKIGTCNHLKNTNTTINEYLKNVTINVNNSDERLCMEYNSDNLYLEITAITKNNQTITFNIPLLIDSCK